MALLFCFYFLLFTQEASYARTPLNDFIEHYDTLNYPARLQLYRRDTEARFEKKHFLEFAAHGRKFELSLRPDTKTLTPESVIIDGDGNKIHFNKNSLLSGEVVGEPGSIVHGVLHDDGVFTGKVHTKDGIYYIESAERYFSNPSDFHSVIYKDEDVKYDVQFAKPKIAPLTVTDKLEWNELPDDTSSQTRKRRSTGDVKENICRLSMEADFTFLTFTKDAILAVGEMLKHVQALNIIYGKTFNTSSTYFPYSLQFHVGLLQVHNKEQTAPGLRRENIDSSTFLSEMSTKDYSKFCQAVYFTYRDFAGGILGLAWIGYPSGRAGGMCDPRRSDKSYNTAIVTFTLQGRTSPPKVSEITFVHEVGHAFGAEHDDEECVPGGEGGNYIMYDKATSGDRSRNDRFSPCSIRQIMANVDAKRGRYLDRNAKIRPRLCLESYDRMEERGDLCGNGVIDDDEECDCGHEEQCRSVERNNSCCDWKTCKLNSGKICSPSQGPCCNAECKTAFEETTCEFGNDCIESTKCPSSQDRTRKGIKHYECPSPKFRPNGTECQGGALLCHNGLCSRSICIKFDLKPCECKDKEEECHACCIDDGVCRSAYKIEKMKRSTPYNYSIGYPCANNTGYCDFFQYCLRVDLEGPLLRLFNLYFTSEGVRELTRKYWWAIMLGTLGLIGIVVLLVKFGAQYTDTDSPDGAPAKPLPRVFCCSNDERDGSNVMELKEAHSDGREDNEL